MLSTPFRGVLINIGFERSFDICVDCIQFCFHAWDVRSGLCELIAGDALSIASGDSTHVRACILFALRAFLAVCISG